MPFWKKSEDPWDYEPEKPSRPAEPGQEEKDCAPSLMDELRDWNEERKEKKALRETPPPPMICPWCGQEMEVGDDHWGTGQCPVVARLAQPVLRCQRPGDRYPP